ncbi:MAG: PAS domain-containing protein [Euryarchaeota archaeon]|nr:PAS domain-containing protein [Euryarchaeota archaeon]
MAEGNKLQAAQYVETLPASGTGLGDSSDGEGEIGIAMVEIDRRLRIRSYNGEFARLMGILGNEALCTSCRALFNCVFSSETCPALRTIMSGKPINVVDVHPCTGVPGPYQFTFYPVRDSSLRVARVVVAIADFSAVIRRFKSELERSYMRLLDVNRRLRDLEGVTTDILSIVSHELKTPLTISMGCIDLAMEEEDSAKLKELLLMARRNLLRENRIIDGMLELSKIRRGVMTLVFRREDIPSLVHKAVKEKLPFAAQREVTFELSLERVPRAEVDPAYFIYALEQIIDNSIKFNRRGGVVKVSTREADGCVEITVEDTGIGIAEENLERVFEPFYQEDSSASRRFPGIGLGLTLASKIVEFHGGRIRLESRGRNTGTRCIIRIPLRRRG